VVVFEWLCHASSLGILPRSVASQNELAEPGVDHVPHLLDNRGTRARERWEKI